MSQFLRPDGIITAGLWTGDPSGADWYLDIDEIVRSDTDFAESNKNQTTLGEASLSDAFDPQTSDNHTFRYVLRMNAAKNVTIVVRLMQGSTTIGGWTHVNPATTFTLFERTTLAAISDYTNLRVQLDVTANAGANAWTEVSWVELEIPDAVRTSDTPAYLMGQELSVSSLSAYLTGPIDVDTSTPAFLDGIPEVTSSMPAYLNSYGQDLEPMGDVNVNLWRNEVGGTVLYPSLDDDNDSTYATIEYAGIGDTFEVAMADPGPIPDNEMYYEWRAWRIEGSQVISMKAELYEGETLIAVDNRVISDTPTTYRRTLSIAERESISNPIDLRVRFTVTGIS